MCRQHWDKLVGLLEVGGYGALIASDDEVAEERLARELDESAGPDDFDPLTTAQNMILGNAIDAAGTLVLGPTADGSDRCPICFLAVPEWLEYAAHDAIEHAKASSLGPTAAGDGGPVT